MITLQVIWNVDLLNKVPVNLRGFFIVYVNGVARGVARVAMSPNSGNKIRKVGNGVPKNGCLIK